MLVIIALLLAANFGALVYPHLASRNQAPIQPSRVLWQYYVMEAVTKSYGSPFVNMVGWDGTIDKKVKTFQLLADEQGKSGWELVSRDDNPAESSQVADGYPVSVSITFKRPVPELGVPKLDVPGL